MAQESVQQVLDRAIKDENGPAGLVFASIDKTGKVLASAASGVRSVDKPDDKVSAWPLEDVKGRLIGSR